MPAMNLVAGEFVYRKRLAKFKYTESSVEVDRNEGIDVFCEAESGIAFAYRVVRSSRSGFFDTDFTVRYTNSMQGLPSEWEKILEGCYASYMIVGLQHPEDALELSKAKLIDVDLLRFQVQEFEGLRQRLEATAIEVRGEPGKFFLALPYGEFPDNVVIDELDLIGKGFINQQMKEVRPMLA
jgi:hypothetical protein